MVTAYIPVMLEKDASTWQINTMETGNFKEFIELPYEML